MNKFFRLLLFCLCLSNIAYAQRAHVIYAEALGSGLLYSVNYDVRLLKKSDGLGLRLGGNISKLNKDELVTFVPAQINYVMGAKHGLELGAGITYSYQKTATSDTKNFVFPNASVMYRYQGDSGFNFRIGWSPIFAPEEKGAVISSKIFWLWPGMSIGYRF